MDGEQVKVLLREGEHAETLWATKVGANLYQLDNSPFFAYGVSWQDIVEAQPTADGQLEMARVAEKRGHRTVRIVFEGGDVSAAAIDSVLAGANALGATYEGASRHYICLDLAPGVRLGAVATYLTQQGVTWEYADPPFEAVAREDRPAPG